MFCLSSKLEAILYKNISQILILGKTTCRRASRSLFLQTVFKNILCLEGGLVSWCLPVWKTACAMCSTFCLNFSSNKNASANRKGGFYTKHLPKNKEIQRDFCIKWQRTLNSLKNSISKLNNLKHKAVNVLSNDI